MSEYQRVQVIDSHTGGEPTRVVIPVRIANGGSDPQFTAGGTRIAWLVTILATGWSALAAACLLWALLAAGGDAVDAAVATGRDPGVLAGVPVVIDSDQDSRWRHPSFHLDVAAGAAGGFSISTGTLASAARRASGRCAVAGVARTRLPSSSSSRAVTSVSPGCSGKRAPRSHSRPSPRRLRACVT